jgi:hypothetical protein
VICASGSGLIVLLNSFLVTFPAASNDAAEEFEDAGAADVGEVGIVGQDGVDDFFSGEVLESAPGVDTVSHFPKNPKKRKFFWMNC